MNGIKKMNGIFDNFKRKKIILAFLLVLLLSLSTVIIVAAQIGDGIDLSWYTINSGAGTSSTSAGYELTSSVGQLATGESITSEGYTQTHGFWQIFIDTLRNMLPFAVKN